MNVATATVETLVAEVRVLMVGSRQITLSVARQLDHVGLEHIEPFGRIRLNGDDASVIGRRKGGTDLVVSSYQQHPSDLVRVHLPEKSITVCGTLASDTLGDLALGYCHSGENWRIRVSATAAARCGIEGHARSSSSGLHCPHWDPRGQTKTIEDAIDQRRQWMRTNQEAGRLPLIVLAGLK